MRELFIVGIKLYGAVNLFSGVSTLASVAAVWRSGPGGEGIVSSWFIAAGISFAVVLLAVTQAERIADLFGLSKSESTHLQGFSAKAALRVGLILIGVSQFLRAVPMLLKEFSTIADPNIPSSPQSNVFALIQIALPLALIFGASRIIKFIDEFAA